MSKAASAEARLLVASDNEPDARLVKRLLGDEFKNVFISASLEEVHEAFEKHSPVVLVLAFDSLHKSERCYLRLYRQCGKVHQQPHRTVVLCAKEELGQAFELCKREHFDDYVLFWPMPQDALRLPMVVHQALRALSSQNTRGPSAAMLAAQARRLKDLESFLDEQTAQGGRHIESAGQAAERVEHDIDVALDGFSRRFSEDVPRDADSSGSLESLRREFNQMREADIRPRLREMTASVQPLQQWQRQFRRESTPHLKTIRNLQAMGKRVRFTVLVVDDVAFHRKILAQSLHRESYAILYAATGLEALSLLRIKQPDLILMDIRMPEMDGIETLRRLKSTPRLSHIPVIMITGHGDNDIVAECLAAGASDFIVKPFTREILSAKVTEALRAAA